MLYYVYTRWVEVHYTMVSKKSTKLPDHSDLPSESGNPSPCREAPAVTGDLGTSVSPKVLGTSPPPN